MVIVTTLLDPKLYSKEDLADLYRARWNNELDLRSIKSVMKMECLRCQTPEMVRKEIWTHALAYNLIRTIMAQAAVRYALPVRTISFKGTLQTSEAFQPLNRDARPSTFKHEMDVLRTAIERHRRTSRRRASRQN